MTTVAEGRVENENPHSEEVPLQAEGSKETENSSLARD
jgi:hypothetical protein